ncbi:hypothetical protein QVD17_38590 [Tagetes erecta]|uniref:Wax synthase domain-containing protein n=1 Tax=Tagetes erecta TaxID=13708 RepID=A0AAD8N9G9_TARER|nr:hypothetical protein QVD17_38590 [Tagetes erecta]
MKDNEELKALINICFIAICCICYCYFISARIHGGVPRLLSLLPIITVFLILPFQISTLHFAAAAFYFFVWLGNFKLLLFAFNRGPLSFKPRLPILTFISIALLPINPKQSNKKIMLDPFSFSLRKPILLASKVAILAMVVHVYSYKDNLNLIVVSILFFFHMYITFELGFGMLAFLVKISHVFNLEIESEFNDPYLATSLQDFWGHRWNLVSSGILRDAVYYPIRMMLGLNLAELAVKNAINGRFRLHRVVSWLLTMAFVIVTGGWLVQKLACCVNFAVNKNAAASHVYL